MFCNRLERFLASGWNEAVYALWRGVEPVERWINLACDGSLTDRRRDALLFTLLNSKLETEDKIRALENLQRTECLTTNLRHTVLLIRGYLEDVDILNRVADSLEELSVENLYLWAEIIGKDPSEQNVTAALRKLNHLELTPEQKIRLSNALAFGLKYDVKMTASRIAFEGRTQRLHPAASEGARIIWEWANSHDGDVAGTLSLLSAAVELGHEEAVDRLSELLTVVIEQHHESLQAPDFDRKVSSALRALANREAGPRTLPLSILAR